MMNKNQESPQGILLVNKPRGKTSFSLVSLLRKVTKERTIGHAGTLDPFATGVMVMLIGRSFTKLSNQFLNQEKEYQATVCLGIATDSFDCDGQETSRSAHIPTLEDIQTALSRFQGEILQTPPMFSAKKVEGKKLYELARKGITIERKAVPVVVKTEFLSYVYPHLELKVTCSKGTYIRSIAHDLGELLGCGAHLSALKRLRCGEFSIDQCVTVEELMAPEFVFQSQHLEDKIQK
jgi:tRNA pseudouridine55 synthase